MNTEASLAEEESQESKYHDEHGDTLAELNNIQRQTKAMGRLNTSQMNVRSLSLSDTGAMMYCSSNDISQLSDGGNVITIQPTSPSIVDLYDNKVKYYKAEDEDQGSPSQGYHSNEMKNNLNDVNNIEEIKVMATDPICLGCTEAKYSEEKVSFLCFSWMKKRKGVTYHTCRQTRIN